MATCETDPPTFTSTIESVSFRANAALLIAPSAVANIVVWQAPFPCTVTNVRGYFSGGSLAIVNAQRNALKLLASDLVLGAQNAWIDGGVVSNTAFALNDTLSIVLVNVGGSPSQVAIQVDFSRP